MHTLTAWFTRNPVAANLLMMLSLVAGFFTLTEIRIEGFPSIPPRVVHVITIYPGANPEQVDRSISQRIVKSLEGMPGIKRNYAVSEEGLSTVSVEKISGFDMDRFQNEIKTRIDSIPNMPQMSERSLVIRDELNVEALVLNVYGNTDEATLQKTARLVREELLADPEIAKIESFGFRPYEIHIELDEERLESLGLTVQDVSMVVHQNSLDYRTGKIKGETGTITIRADDKAFNYEDFSKMPIKTEADGTRILLSDVANIVDGFSETDFVARFNGTHSVGFAVYTSGKGHLLRVSDAAHQVVSRLQPQLPEGIKLDVWAEYSQYMKDRLNLLKNNAWQGLLIVFVLLALFLDLRLAFWVAMGIPISISAVFVVMGERFLDYSLNDITTFGLIVVMGILVDDAVVVGESVFETRRKIKSPIDGTIEGVHRVATATVFGAMTTIAAFYPLLLIDNDLGKIFASFSVIVIIALIASLLESKFILPSHLAALNLESDLKRNPLTVCWGYLQKGASGALDFVNHRVYTPVIQFFLIHRYSTLVVFIAVAVVGIGSIFNGRIRTVFFPDIPGQIITVNLNMHSGSPTSLMLDNVRTIERCAEELNVALKKKFNTDEAPIARIMTAVMGDYNAQIWAELQPEKQRLVGTMETLRQWRERVGKLEGVEDLSFSGTFEIGGGFAIEVSGRDQKMIDEAVGLLSERLASLEGISDVTDDLNSGVPRIRLKLKPEAQHLGITRRMLAESIGDTFGGLEIQRVQRDSEEVKIVVMYAKDRRKHLKDLLRTKITTESGMRIPLTSVAEIISDYQPLSIYRKNMRRTIMMRAKLDKKVITASEAFAYVKQQIEPEIALRYPGIVISGAGEVEEMGEMKSGLKKAVIIIFLLIYVLLAIPLKSYWQPFVIMSVIPFGFVGAAIGHGLTGHSLSVLSFFGMLAAMGVVVNDSLVMLTRFNQLHEEGMPLNEALLVAGTSRFRAIFLTTVTTVCGLLPLLTETSEQAQYLIPAAISLAFGELFATPITLCLVPLLIRIAHDIASFFGFSEATDI